MAFFEGVVRHETHFTIAIWFILYFFTSLALSYIFSYVLLHIIGWRDVPGQRWTKCGYVILFRMFLGDVGTVELQIARFVSNNLLASKAAPFMVYPLLCVMLIVLYKRGAVQWATNQFARERDNEETGGDESNRND
ncbi:uncharacterized protein [Ptychodera flava]|uniref:uncharacterized protein isoform X1 n=1 Tax=Ptychodera flava TaxID=63121 RepID=UPI003969C4BD